MSKTKVAKKAPAQSKDEEISKLRSMLDAYSFISSHDLQEPLRSLQIFTSILLEKEGKNLSENGKIYLKKLAGSANKIRLLINDLVEYTNTVKSLPERVELMQVVAEAERNLQPLIRKTHASIEYAALPTVNVVRFQFVKVFTELMSNSIRFSRYGVNPVIKIHSRELDAKGKKSISVDPERRFVEISVEDNGLGFDEKFNDKVFQIFQKLHDPTKSGSGIGLPTCKKIVENHDGFIIAGSEAGVGTIIKIYLPVE